MTTDVQVATLVGQAWEELVGDAVAALSGSYERSPKLGPGVIRPDFLRTDRRVAICVTSTNSTQTFMRKRWRYINEVFQLKTLLGHSVACVNVVAADPAILREGGASILELLFDASINLSTYSVFESIHSELLADFSKGKQADAVLRKLRTRDDVKSLIKATTKELTRSVAAPAQARTTLWQAVAKKHSVSAPAAVAPTPPTYFRRTCLRLMPLKANERALLLAAATSRKPVTIDPATLSLCGLETTRAIGGTLRLSDPEIIATLTNGFSIQDVAYGCGAIDALARAKGFPIQEITDSAAIARRVTHLKMHLGSAKSLAEELERQFQDESLSRVWAIEYLTAWRGLSMLRLNKDYVQKHGKIGVTNPIDNITLKTDMSRALVRDKRADALWRQLGALLLADWAPAGRDDNALVTAVREYRRKSLLLQPYLNPTRALFEKMCGELGIHVQCVSADCLLNDLGLGGRGSRVEEVYMTHINSETTYFKVLSGYKGGYEHKADEMGARSWLLRFRKDGTGFGRSDVRLIFVFEGEWTQEYLDMLLASGWSNLIPLTAFRTNVRAILDSPRK